MRLAPRLGQRAVLHFWASWCGPCRKEIPDLLAARASVRPVGTDVVLVAVDDSPREAASLIGSATATLYDPGWKLAKLWRVERVPTTLLVEGGREVERIEGPAEWRDPAVRRRLLGHRD